MANMSLKKNPMPSQEPDVRNKNFDEVALGYTEEMAIDEAKRCLNCKNPKCVNGCPVNVHIPEFIAKVAEGKFDEAFGVITSTNSLPAICGRVCPQENQCEGQCIRGIKGEPVGIGRLERFVADYHNTHGHQGGAPVVPESNGHKVAVVGSGPAGLTCAGDLARKGYDVTVFEALHQVGGVLVDSGNFNWENGRFEELCAPDESYHGVTYTKQFGRAAYITKARVQLMRDLGCYPSAQAAFLLNHGLETLHLRMERHCQNAEQVARFLQQHGKVESVNYPTLAEDPYYQLAQKYLPNGCSGVISFSLTGGREAAVRFIDSLKLASLVVHVADVRTLVLHPASSTHRQLTDEQLVAAGIHPGMIRLSVGIEHVDDIIEDLKQALEQA